MRDLGVLLSSAGFTLTTVDVDHVVVRYPDMFALLDDLRAMGENNAIVHRCDRKRSWGRSGNKSTDICPAGGLGYYDEPGTALSVATS